MNVTNRGFIGSLPKNQHPISESPSSQWQSGSGDDFDERFNEDWLNGRDDDSDTQNDYRILVSAGPFVPYAYAEPIPLDFAYICGEGLENEECDTIEAIARYHLGFEGRRG